MTRHSLARGFTLLEMLVALSILSLAALALIRLDAFAVRTAAVVDGSALARIVAANAAADILTAPAAPTIGQASTHVTNGGRSWTITTVAQSDNAGMLRIDIRVVGEGDQAALTLYRASGPAS